MSEIVSGYAFILPAITLIAWILSWRGSRRLRWGVLALSAVLSVLCYFIAFLIPKPPDDPALCPTAWSCGSWDSIYWLETAVFGLICSVALAVLTAMAEVARLIINALTRDSIAR